MSAILDSSYERLDCVCSMDKDNIPALTSNNYRVTVEPVILYDAFGFLPNLEINLKPRTDIVPWERGWRFR